MFLNPAYQLNDSGRNRKKTRKTGRNIVFFKTASKPYAAGKAGMMGRRKLHVKYMVA